LWLDAERFRAYIAINSTIGSSRFTIVPHIASYWKVYSLGTFSTGSLGFNEDLVERPQMLD